MLCGCKTIGLALAAAGIGMLASVLFSSIVLRLLLGAACLGVGILLLEKA